MKVQGSRFRLLAVVVVMAVMLPRANVCELTRAAGPGDVAGPPLGYVFVNGEINAVSDTLVGAITDPTGDVASLNWLKPHPTVWGLVISGPDARVATPWWLFSMNSGFHWFAEVDKWSTGSILDRAPNSGSVWNPGIGSSISDPVDSQLLAYEDMTGASNACSFSGCLHYWQFRGNIPSGQPDLYYFHSINNFDYLVYLYPTVRGWEWEVDARNASFSWNSTAYEDITASSVTRIAGGKLRFQMTVASDVPATPAVEAASPWLGWKLDIDNDSATGQKPDGDDVFVVVRYDKDSGTWQGVVRKWDGSQYQDTLFVPFTRSGKNVTIEVSISDLGISDTFRWHANASVIVSVMGDEFFSQVERAPDQGWATMSLNEVDLNIRNQQPYVAVEDYPLEPGTTTLKIKVVNEGSLDAEDVIVKFYRGQPVAGNLIGTATIERIVSGTIAYPECQWQAPHNSEADVYVTAYLETPGAETDLADNETSTETAVRVYYADFKYRRDTFNFPNWEMTMPDFQSEVVDAFQDVDSILYLPWRNIVAPAVYAYYAEAGHCFGMANASIVFWDTPSVKPVPSDTPIFDIAESLAKPIIRDHHTRQILANFAELFQDSSPNSAYGALLSKIKSRQPAILSWCEGSLTCDEGHAVTAFKIVEVGDNKTVVIYDNKTALHASSKFAKFDANLNTFTYGKSYPRVYVDEPVRSVSKITAEVIEEVQRAVCKRVEGLDVAQVYLGSPATALLTDQSGRRIGITSGGSFVSEIPGATMDDFGGSYRFQVPAGLHYTVTTRGTGSGTLSLSFLLPLGGGEAQEVVYTDVPVSPGSTTTTELSQTTIDWTMHLSSGGTRQPELVERVQFERKVYMPLALRNRH